MLIFPTVADAGGGVVFYGSAGCDISTSRRNISVNIDGLGNANIGVNSQDREDHESSTRRGHRGGQDAEPMTFMFTKSIVASGNGIQKAILYLENN